MANVAEVKRMYDLCLGFEERCKRLREGRADFRDLCSREYYHMFTVLECLVSIKQDLRTLDGSPHTKVINAVESLWGDKYVELIGFSDLGDTNKQLRMWADYSTGRFYRDNTDIVEIRKIYKEMVSQTKRLKKILDVEMEMVV